MRKFLFTIVLMVICISGTWAQLSADQIVDKAIEKAGGDRFDHATIHFTFRGKQYRSTRENGNFRLERMVSSPQGMIHDIVSNQGLQRSIDNCTVKVVDSLITRISDGVNSVHYFANLPYGLNAPAVNKEFVGETTIKGQPYFKVKVTFDQEGGGTDFEDEFLYWIHKDSFTVDYLAYKYAVNGGGIRFREAYNPRMVNSIRFVDYKNYKAEDLRLPLSELDGLFEKGALTLLSKIELEDIYVYPEDDCC